jgi:hypothetical protein
LPPNPFFISLTDGTRLYKCFLTEEKSVICTFLIEENL